MSGRPCPVCGTDVPPNNAFCGACGARMPKSVSGAGHDQLIGRVIDGRFRILNLLGSGGMGAVYLAEHVGIGKQVAIKVLRADLRDNRDLLRRFRREAMAVSKLADAHTITVFDYGVWKGLVYLVMEYLRGTDLAAVLDAEGRMSVERCLRVARQVCSSLTEAHALGVVHRDLKPENIFLTRTTTGEELVKVLDFGLAKILRSEHRQETFETQKGALLGTPYYMAPELIDSEMDAVSGRTDLYALGALLFRMLTGQYAYTGTTAVRVLEKHLTADLPAFANVAPDLPIPMEVETLVRSLMARAPRDRPKDARAVAQWIHSLLQRGMPTSVVVSDALPATSARGQTTQPERPDAAFAATFSTSSFDEPPLVQSNATEKVFGEVDVGPLPLMRREFEQYESNLIWRRRIIGIGTTLLVLAAIASAVWYFGFRVPDAHIAEVEPNDDPREATPIQPGVTISGFIGRRSRRERGDRDIYLLHTTPGAAVNVQVSGVPGIDLLVEGYTAASADVFKVNKGGVGEGETITGIKAPEDRLYIVVRERSVDGQTPSENSTDGYQLLATIPPTTP